MTSPPPPPPPPAVVGLEAVARLLLPAVLVVFVGLAATNTLRDLAAIATIPGEFSHGEAGKAFFAWRWRLGQSLFLSADQPPHYPSFHGPALHVLVGSLAWALGLSRDALMGAGRVMALVGLGGMVGVLVALGRSLGLSWRLVPAVVLLFLSSSSTHMASAAYRPDTWMALCSVATCLVFLQARHRPWGLGLLVALPVLGYLFKPLGLSAAAATVVAFALAGDWRRAAVYAGASGATLVVVVGALQWASGGLYLSSFAEGVRVESGLAVMLGLLPPANVWVPVVVALAAAVWAAGQRPKADEDTSRALAMGAYLALALAAALVGTSRAGAYFYYYLETFAFASPLAVWGVAQVTMSNDQRTRVAAMFVAVVAIVVLWQADVRRSVAGPFLGHQVAEALEAERAEILRQARATGIRVFTNDPVLSVRLDDQAILYTGLMGQMIEAGTLDPESYQQPLRQGRWPLLALLNERLPHIAPVSVDRLPGFEAILALYEPVAGPGPLYRLYRLKRPAATPDTTSGS